MISSNINNANNNTEYSFSNDINSLESQNIIDQNKYVVSFNKNNKRNAFQKECNENINIQNSVQSNCWKEKCEIFE